MTAQHGLGMFSIQLDLLVLLTKPFVLVSKVSPNNSVFGCEGKLDNVAQLPSLP